MKKRCFRARSRRKGIVTARHGPCGKAKLESGPKSSSPATQQAIHSDATVEEKFGSNLLELLLTAERHGLIRWVLEGTATAFRALQKKREGPHGLPPDYLLERRTIVAQYLASLIRQFDAMTMSEVIHDLLFELRIRGTTSGSQEATAAGIPFQRDEFAVRAILLVMCDITNLFCEAAREYPETFASELALTTTNLVETLNEIADQRPQAFHDIAGESIAWPVMTMRHYPKRSDFNELAERIQLGKRARVKPRERHKWKPHTPLNRYILDMLLTECWGDGRLLTEQTRPYYLDKVLMPLFDEVAAELGGWENYPEFAAVARSAAKRGKAGVQRSEIRGRVDKALKALSA